jgi:hypothetical protein
MNEGACVLEHSVEADVSVAFAWNFWTDITNWDDPPAQFMLDGAFVDGARGRTVLPGQPVRDWTIRHVRMGRSATIEMEVEGATLAFEWRFDPLDERRTNLTQRVMLSGEKAWVYMEQVRAAFESNLPAGMERIATAMVKAEATSSGRPLG